MVASINLLKSSNFNCNSLSKSSLMYMLLIEPPISLKYIYNHLYLKLIRVRSSIEKRNWFKSKFNLLNAFYEKQIAKFLSKAFFEIQILLTLILFCLSYLIQIKTFLIFPSATLLMLIDESVCGNYFIESRVSYYSIKYRKTYNFAIKYFLSKFSLCKNSAKELPTARLACGGGLHERSPMSKKTGIYNDILFIFISAKNIEKYHLINHFCAKEKKGDLRKKIENTLPNNLNQSKYLMEHLIKPIGFLQHSVQTGD
ncbi:hypothetical protein BpHYR1_004015 [Brachionus plicatilis]|uniref:Uncharacterized protein n=1 Tax=Brachionus plicatilis TaxID=10195 RepID=A0A3M7T0X9_BRAPC|nr:hypothetical protein BpHYR1_004015 [Brachionus plicatilis]